MRPVLLDEHRGNCFIFPLWSHLSLIRGWRSLQRNLAFMTRFSSIVWSALLECITLNLGWNAERRKLVSLPLRMLWMIWWALWAATATQYITQPQGPVGIAPGHLRPVEIYLSNKYTVQVPSVPAGPCARSDRNRGTYKIPRLEVHQESPTSVSELFTKVFEMAVCCFSLFYISSTADHFLLTNVLLLPDESIKWPTDE